MQTALARVFPVLSFFLLFSSIAHSQLVVNNATNAVVAVQDYLLGEGVTATNITYSGNNDQIASFTCNNCNLGIASGVIMSSGNASTAAGPNNQGGSSTSYGGGVYDADLDAISAVSINDASILQFDFVPTGDSLVFNFVFGSDEYPEYSNSSFNDAFGFFLSGPGISGPFTNQAINIALIPGTTVPVTINNVNNGATGTGGPCEYCQYYIHNGTGTQAPYNSNNYYIQPDGFTTVIQAYAQVQCGETYHIKLAIADGGDTSFNSWVFLEAGSFASNSLDLSFNQPGIAPSLNSLYEGCNGASVTFTRPPALQGDITFNVDITGTAVNGVDYEAIPTEVFFPDGVDEVTIPINGIVDGLTEGQETIILTVEAPVTCASTATLELFIQELPPLNVTAPQELEVGCNEVPMIDIGISGGYGQYSVSWDSGQTGEPIIVPAENATYTYTVSDVCGVASVSGDVDVVLEEYQPLEVSIGGDQSLTCIDNVVINPNASGGGGGYSYEWYVNGELYSSTQIFNWFNPEEGEVSVVVTDVCGNEATSAFNVSIPPVEVIVDLGPDLNAPCLDNLVIDASVSGGVGFYDYSWTVDGQDAGTESSIEIPVGSGASVSLTVIDQCGNTSSDDLVVSPEAEPLQVDLGGAIMANCLETVSVNATVDGAIGNVSYSWTIDGAAAGADTFVTFTAGDGASVTVNVVDECGNTGTQTIEVDVPPVPVNVGLGQDLVATCLDFVDLVPTVDGGIGSYSYDWSINGIAAGNGPTLSFPAGDNLSVELSVTDACGNVGTDVISVDVTPVAITINMAASQNVTCLSNFTISPTVTGGVGAFTYEWEADGSTVGAGPTVTYATDENLVLTLTVSDACGNVATDQINIIVNAATINLTTTPDQVICPGESVNLSVTASGGIGGYTYQWSTGNSGTQVNVSPDEDETFTVNVDDQCGNEASASIDVQVLNASQVFEAEDEITLCNGVSSGTIVFGGITPYSYDFDSDSLSYSAEEGFTGLLEGTSTVIVTDACGNEEMVIVHISPCSTIIPNIFSPNGDNKNQFFHVDGLEGFPRSSLQVFNRWGGQVFESDNYSNNWDGDELPEGTYFYVLKRSDGEEFSGYVTLVR